MGEGGRGKVGGEGVRVEGGTVSTATVVREGMGEEGREEGGEESGGSSTATVENSNITTHKREQSCHLGKIYTAIINLTAN